MADPRKRSAEYQPALEGEALGVSQQGPVRCWHAGTIWYVLSPPDGAAATAVQDLSRYKTAKCKIFINHLYGILNIDKK